MSEPATAARSEELAATAFLYVNGELESDEAADFEARAAGDAACQEALIQAVKLWSGVRLPAELQPDAHYRQRVQERLRGRRLVHAVRPSRRREVWSSFAGAVVGALAATVLVTLLNPWQWLNQPPTTVIIAPESAAHTAGPAAEVIYSDLSNTNRLARVRDEKEHRRQRDDDLRLSHPIIDHLRQPQPAPKQRMM